MNFKMIASFGVGLVIGAIGGVFVSRKLYSRKIEELMDALYEDDDVNCDNSENNNNNNNNEDGGEENVNDEKSNDSKKGVENNTVGNGSGHDNVDLNKIRDRVNRNWEQTSNYASMYSNPEPEDVDHDENYSSEALTREEIEEEETFDDYQNNKGRKPKIISLEDFSSFPPSVDTAVLYYYRYDDILVDENDEVIDEPERLIGDSLIKYGWDESDEVLMFVMNYDLNTAYEIHKIFGSFNFPNLNE